MESINLTATQRSSHNRYPDRRTDASISLTQMRAIFITIAVALAGSSTLAHVLHYLFVQRLAHLKRRGVVRGSN